VQKSKIRHNFPPPDQPAGDAVEPNAGGWGAGVREPARKRLWDKEISMASRKPQDRTASQEPKRHRLAQGRGDAESGNERRREEDQKVGANNHSPSAIVNYRPSIPTGPHPLVGATPRGCPLRPCGCPISLGQARGPAPHRPVPLFDTDSRGMNTDFFQKMYLTPSRCSSPPLFAQEKRMPPAKIRSCTY